jgi:hypothetical protein
MEKTKFRQFELPRNLEVQIEKNLVDHGLRLSDSQKIAQSIQKMSDFYIQNPEGQTPWKEPWANIAQLTYYLPLNYLRAKAVVQEAIKQNFFDGLQTVTEIGSGLGALTGNLAEHFKKISCIEISEPANRLHQKLFLEPKEFLKKEAEVQSDMLALSYALTEIPGIEKIFDKYKALLIIEPSTSQDSRHLLAIREKLIAQGFSIWAPCTHQKNCPLLHESKKDWCHDRIHLKMPDWYLKVEQLLPFKNRTITFSYLLARKDKKPNHQANDARLIGDLLPEKGKTRIMVCRQDKREFLSWLTKDKIELELYRGDLLKLDFPFEEKSNELRLKKGP